MTSHSAQLRNYGHQTNARSLAIKREVESDAVFESNRRRRKMYHDAKVAAREREANSEVRLGTAKTLNTVNFRDWRAAMKARRLQHARMAKAA
jgi:hypothetical protein